jgi:hypothetical protein
VGTPDVRKEKGTFVQSREALLAVVCARLMLILLVGRNQKKAGQMSGEKETPGLCQHDVIIQQFMRCLAACNGVCGVAANRARG